MLWALVAILIVLWILGLLLKVAGAFIWILLVAAIIVGLWNVIAGRRTV